MIVKYTPEPWYAIPHPEYKAGLWRIDSDPNAPHGNFHPIAMANRYNANRIVSCVNALAGIEDPEQWVQQLQADNERLRKALGDLLHHCTTEDGIDRTAFDKAIENAEQVLKGGADESK